MAKVVAKPGESFESMNKRFKKQMIKDGTLLDLRKHEYYVSPSQKRRLKHEAALKKLQKKTV
mgnify:CR=1 FL=1